MNAPKIQVGVIGYGHRGRFMFRLCGQIPSVRLKAVCDLDRSRADTAKRDHPGILFYNDPDRMLRQAEVDAVLVETHPREHAACAIAALKHNVHVISDCPAVHAIPEAKRLWDAVRQSSAMYSFGENVNYWAFVQTCLDLKQAGLLGNPYYLEAEYVHDLGTLVESTPWRRHYQPIRYCTHSLGPVLKWLDEDLISVACFDTHSHMRPDPENHDAMVALFHTASNVTAKVLCSFNNRHPRCYHRFVYFGTEGYFERSAPVGGGQRTLFSSRKLYGARDLTVLPVDFARPDEDERAGHGGADFTMLKDFIGAILERRPPPIDVRQALRMTLPGLYALASAEAHGALTPIQYPWSAEPAGTARNRAKR